jgi:hypothetical protein
MELPSLGECDDATDDRSGLLRQGNQGPNYLHARGTLGDLDVNDPIVDEVRRIRDANAARFDYDLDAIFQDIKEQEKKSGLTFVSGAARQTRQSQAHSVAPATQASDYSQPLSEETTGRR